MRSRRRVNDAAYFSRVFPGPEKRRKVDLTFNPDVRAAFQILRRGNARGVNGGSLLLLYPAPELMTRVRAATVAEQSRARHESIDIYWRADTAINLVASLTAIRRRKKNTCECDSREVLYALEKNIALLLREWRAR